MTLPNINDYMTWIPVLDNMGYAGKKKKELCKYCVVSSNLEAQEELYIDKKDIGVSKLPMSLKILSTISTLNNDNVIFTSDSEIESKNYKCTIEIKSELRDVLKPDIMSEYLEALILKNISIEIDHKIMDLLNNTEYDIVVFNTNNLITKIDTNINVRGKSCIEVLYKIGLKGF